MMSSTYVLSESAFYVSSSKDQKNTGNAKYRLVKKSEEAVENF